MAGVEGPASLAGRARLVTACASGSGQRHYEVFSPIMRSFIWEEAPPDESVCWGVYLASTAKKAIALAVAAPAFREWTQEKRACGEPPFKGLTAVRFECEHGRCLECEICVTCPTT